MLVPVGQALHSCTHLFPHPRSVGLLGSFGNLSSVASIKTTYLLFECCLKSNPGDMYPALSKVSKLVRYIILWFVPHASVYMYSHWVATCPLFKSLILHEGRTIAYWMMFVSVVTFIVTKDGFSAYKYSFFDGTMVVEGVHKYSLKVDSNKDTIIVKLCTFFRH